MAKAAELAASSRAERVDKVRDHLQRVDDAVKLEPRYANDDESSIDSDIPLAQLAARRRSPPEDEFA